MFFIFVFVFCMLLYVVVFIVLFLFLLFFYFLVFYCLLLLCLPFVANKRVHYQDMWRRYRRLTKFFPIIDTCLSCEDTALQSCAMVTKWRYFASCICSEPRAAHFRHAFWIRTKATPCLEVC